MSWRMAVRHSRLFTTRGHIAFSCWKLIFKKYPIPTCNQPGVIEIQVFKLFYGMRTLCKTNWLYTVLFLNWRGGLLLNRHDFLVGFAKSRPAAQRPTAPDGPAADSPRRPGGPVAQPWFSSFFCPAVNPRACTDLRRIRACKMDDGEFEFVYHLCISRLRPRPRDPRDIAGNLTFTQC